MKIIFQYCVCVRSFEHFCGEEKLFCSTVTVCDHFPKIVFSLETKVSGEQEQECVFVAMEFTVQVSTFVELKLLWR